MAGAFSPWPTHEEVQADLAEFFGSGKRTAARAPALPPHGPPDAATADPGSYLAATAARRYCGGREIGAFQAQKTW